MHARIFNMRIFAPKIIYNYNKILMKKTILKLALLSVCIGWTSSTWALDQVNGVYQIGTADDLIDFANRINNGTISNSANAVLTADINMSGKSYTPIGNDSHRYGGMFNGQGHVVDHLVLNNGSYDNQGIFGVVTGGATIKNLIAGPNNSITGKGNVGGLIGITNGNDSEWITIENCGNEGYVEAKGTGGAAIIGICYNGSRKTKILNCYNTGNIKANNEAAILTGWFGGDNSEAVVRNFYNTGDVSGQESDKYFCRGNNGTFTFENVYDNHSTTYTQPSQTVKPCASAWYRWPYDLNFSGNTKTTVWKFVGSVNHPRPIAEAPVSKDGDYYLLADKHDLYWLATVVNKGNTGYNAKLTSEIDFSDYTQKAGNGDDGLVKNVMIGKDEVGFRYQGHFNGQGHTVTVDYDCTAKLAALFGMLDGAIIENLRTVGSITTSNQHGAGIAGGSIGSTQIRNCISAVNITGTGSGDGTHAGICGFMYDDGSITNCAFVGSLTAENCTGNAGLLGYANGGDSNVLTNCYVYADFKFKSTDSKSWAMKRNTSSIINCYYIKKSESGDFHVSNNDSQLANYGHFEDATIVGNGNLCYHLNGSSSENPEWYQTLNTDDYPLPFMTSDIVFYDNGNYTNVNNNNFFELETADDLKWFAEYVNGGHTTINGKLTADIDFSGINDYPGIGQNKVNENDPNPENKFAGTLDGDYHKITNLTMTYNDKEGVGLINSATAGAVIKNLTIASSCSFSGKKAVGAFVGGVYENSGNVTFLNCGNEGSVTSTGQNAGGILGCNFNGNIAIHMTNCYNTGAITSGSEGGALSGWVSANKQIINCYNSGNLTNSAGFVRGDDNGSITHCWSTSNAEAGNNCRHANNILDGDTQLQDGTVFTALHNYNENGVDGSVWKMEFEGPRHPVLYAGPVGLAEDFPNIIETSNNVDVTMYRTIKKDGWNTFCVPFSMNATQIASYFGNGTVVAQLKENVPNDDVLHFETVSTITAGKAYLVYPGVNDNFTSKAITGVSITATTPDNGVTQAGYAFKGVFVPTALTAGTDYIVAGGSNIVKVKENSANLKAFRAYFHPESTAARATSFVIDDGTATGIITAEGEVLEDGPVYNLNGQRVGQATRGIYIMNGKKVVMK